MAAPPPPPLPSDDLDQLLDSALDDFTKLDLKPRGDGAERGGGVAGASPVQGLGLGLGLPELKAKGKGKQHAPPRHLAEKGPSHASEALEKLTQQTREAVRGLESATVAAAASRGGSKASSEEEEEEGMVEEFVKQFEELAGSQDMQSIVETMMKQLLSKEILQEPMKEIGERYPKWLEEHKMILNKEEYERYKSQYELILKLNDVYERDPDNFTEIVDLMQKMQECGQPPSELVQELAPDIDLNNLGGQLWPSDNLLRCI